MDALEPAFQPTRRTLGEVDPVQPLDTTHPLLRGVQGFWLPLPGLTGGSRLYDLSAQSNHGEFAAGTPKPNWVNSPNFALSGQRFDPSGAETVVPHDKSLDLSSANYSIFVVLRLDPLADQDSFFGVLHKGIGGSADGTLSDYGIQRNGSTDNLVIYHSDGQGNQGFVKYSNLMANLVGGVQTLGVRYTQSSSEVEVYRNGTSEGIKTIDQNPDNNGRPLHIGASRDPIVMSGDIYAAYISRIPQSIPQLHNQARRGFPDLLRTRSDVGLLGGGIGPISGTAAITDAQEQISATGQTKVSGTLSVTDGSETLTVDGAVITTGTAQITDSGEIISAVSSLQEITGTAQITDAGEQIDATGEVKIAGTASLADGTEEVIIVGQNDVTGSVSFADLAAEIAAEGSVRVQGSLALTDLGESISARERVPARLATVDVRLEDIIIVHAKLTD
jgi:hypothetical protein